LTSVKDESIKAKIYSALATVEKSRGNNIQSAYCKDKSLEYDPDNREELFNSAFIAGEENVEAISLSNYITLLQIDRNNAAALNNLGALAKEIGLEVKAVENYKKAANLNNTLAMSNLGYLFLNSGFTEEAEEIAKTASQLDNPHPNLYSLLSQINQKKEEQDKKWNELIEKYFKKQKQIRNYTEQFYLGSGDKLDGEWVPNNNTEISININSASGIIDAFWNEPINKFSSDLAKVELRGNISGSTFTGFYKKNRENNNNYTALLMIADNINISCIGFLSEDERVLNIVSDKQKDDFSMSMYKK
jgi:tetratricopeptide (TPR) repeat protein